MLVEIVNFRAVMRSYSLSSMTDVPIAASDFINISCQAYMLNGFITHSDFTIDGLN